MTFSSVKYKPLGPLAAMTNIATRELTLNSEVWDKLPDFIQRYILLHEEGHLFNGTKDEAKADEYAKAKFIDRSTPERFKQTTEEYRKIQEIYNQATAQQRQRVSEIVKNMPGEGKDVAAEPITIVIALATLAYTGYKAWKGTNDAKLAAKNSTIAAENSAALQIYAAQTQNGTWKLYTGAGMIGLAIVLWIFGRKILSTISLLIGLGSIAWWWWSKNAKITPIGPSYEEKLATVVQVIYRTPLWLAYVRNHAIDKSEPLEVPLLHSARYDLDRRGLDSIIENPDNFLRCFGS